VRRRLSVLAAALLLVPGVAPAHEHGEGHGPVSPTEAPILITINPEQRVSVALGGALPPAAACGTPVHLPVKIENQAFVTFRLEAALVEDVPAGASVMLDPEPLKGVPHELRGMHVMLTKPGLTDLTIAFRARNEAPDLGGRDRVHFLMRCL
jgi:hypothetical protein